MLGAHETAAALLVRYAVWGKYYDLNMQDETGARTVPMRSHLELFDHRVSPEQATTQTPDAVAVMMNPGSSEPLPTMALVNGYSPAKPDTTQYQLMRVMQAVGWRHVRVLNLSDFRAPKSKDFIAFLAVYAGHEAHSIFALARAAQLDAALGECKNIVLGWGVNPAFEPWAQRVLRVVSGRRVLGVQGQADWIFKHPLPLAQPAGQRAWVSTVTEQVWAGNAALGGALGEALSVHNAV